MVVIDWIGFHSILNNNNTHNNAMAVKNPMNIEKNRDSDHGRLSYTFPSVKKVNSH